MKMSVIGLRGFPMVEGGVEKHCQSLYPRIDSDIEITVYRRKPYVRTDGDYKHISFIDIPSTQIKGFEAFIHSFLSSVHALLKKPDLIHYHNIGPALFSPIVKIRKIPVVFTYHSPNYEHDKWNSAARKLLKLSERIALKTADQVIFVNQFQMDKFSDEIKAKSRYIPNGINKLPIVSDTDYLKEIGVEPGKYIFSIGRITNEKGFDILIKAFKKAQKNGYKLVIAGGVEYENGYMKELKALSEGADVIFTGYVEGNHLHQLYTHAGLYVLSSRNEGFPIVLLEAMRYELDVIVSDIPATHLVDLNEGDYFPCNSVDGLADKISERVKTPRKRTYDLTKYDWDQIAAEMSQIYRRNCRGRT